MEIEDSLSAYKSPPVVSKFLSPFFAEDEGSRFLLNATNYQTSRRYIQKTVIVVITAMRT
jgi:hypothetical protein